MHKDTRTVEEEIAHCAVTLGHLPVVDRNVGRWQFFPFGKTTRVEIFNLARVCDDSFFLEVANEAVNSTWAEEVGEEQCVAPYALGSKHHEAHETSWSLHLEEDQEVHAFIVTFLD